MPSPAIDRLEVVEIKDKEEKHVPSTGSVEYHVLGAALKHFLVEHVGHGVVASEKPFTIIGTPKACDGRGEKQERYYADSHLHHRHVGRATIPYRIAEVALRSAALAATR
jgi:hypothetical protein